MWSVSGHSVLPRLSGLSDKGIPLPPLLLSWDYKYRPQCLTFFVGTEYLNSCSDLCKAKNTHTETFLKSQCGILSLEDSFVFIER